MDKRILKKYQIYLENKIEEISYFTPSAKQRDVDFISLDIEKSDIANWGIREAGNGKDISPKQITFRVNELIIVIKYNIYELLESEIISEDRDTKISRIIK